MKKDDFEKENDIARQTVSALVTSIISIIISLLSVTVTVINLLM